MKSVDIFPSYFQTLKFDHVVQNNIPIVFLGHHLGFILLFWVSTIVVHKIILIVHTIRQTPKLWTSLEHNSTAVAPKL